ncbi:hypothetical protein [Desulfocurvus sp. DL9XJH121]
MGMDGIGSVNPQPLAGAVSGARQARGAELDPRARELFGGRSVRGEDAGSPLRSSGYRPGISLREKATHFGHRVLRTVAGWFSKGSAKVARARADHAQYLSKSMKALQNGELDRFRFYFGKLRTEGGPALSRGVENKDLMGESLRALIKDEGYGDDDVMALARKVDQFGQPFRYDDMPDAGEDYALLQTLAKGMMREGAKETVGLEGLSPDKAVAPPDVVSGKGEDRQASLFTRLGSALGALAKGRSPEALLGPGREKIEALDQAIREDCEELGLLQDEVLDSVVKGLGKLEALGHGLRPEAQREKLDAILGEVRESLGKAIGHVTRTMHQRVSALATNAPVLTGDNATQDRFASVMALGKRVIGNLTARYEALARAAEVLERRSVVRHALFELQSALNFAERKDRLGVEDLESLGRVVELVEAMAEEGFKPDAMSREDLDANLELLDGLLEKLSSRLPSFMDVGGRLGDVRSILAEAREAKSDLPAWAKDFGRDADFMRESLTRSMDLYLHTSAVRNARTLTSARGLLSERFNQAVYQFLRVQQKGDSAATAEARRTLNDHFTGLALSVSTALVEAGLRGGSESEIANLTAILDTAKSLYEMTLGERDYMPRFIRGDAPLLALDVAREFAQARSARSKDFGPSIGNLLTAFQGVVASRREGAWWVLFEQLEHCVERGKFGEGKGQYPFSLESSLQAFAGEWRRTVNMGRSDGTLTGIEGALQGAGVDSKLTVHDARLDFGGSLKLLVNRDQRFKSGVQGMKWVTLPRPEGATPKAYRGLDIREGHGSDRVGYAFKNEANRLKPLSRLTVDQYQALFERLRQDIRK